MTALSILIVNYKTPELVLDCLKSIYEQTKGISFEIIVADNASGDNSRERILEAYPAVYWIQMSYNAGFARANNEAIRQSSSEVILLLNSDTIIEDGSIERCFLNFSHSGYAACGVQLLNTDRTPQISGNFFMKGGLNYLLPLPYLGRLIKWGGNLFEIAKPNVPDAGNLIEVDWINGAFLMVKKEVTDKAGLMDEDFFLYAEEAEWCSRLRKLGKLCIYGQCKVIHLQGESANETFSSAGKGYTNLFDRKGLQIMISNFVRIRKQFGVGWFLVQLFFYLLEIPVFFTSYLLTLPFGDKSHQHSFSQITGYCRNVGVLLGKSMIIIRNKPYFYKVL
ncbi:glycosyltransferase family 2 protein [Flavitalea flava]